MKIGPNNQLNRLVPEDQLRQTKTESASEVLHRKDTIEISDAGREKLQELADSKTAGSGDVKQAKIARIRNKVEAGYYDLTDIQEKITERLTGAMLQEINDTINME